MIGSGPVNYGIIIKESRRSKGMLRYVLSKTHDV